MKYLFEDKIIDVHMGNKNYKVQLVKTNYDKGGVAIKAVVHTTGEPFGKLTINIPEKANCLGEDKVFIKSYSENTELAKAARESGLFAPTGEWITSGFVKVEIWKLRKEN